MDQRQLAVRARLRLHQPDSGTSRREAVAQQPVLAHGEAVAGRQGQHELVGIEDLHRRHFPVPTSLRECVLDCCNAAKSACNAARHPYTSPMLHCNMSSADTKQTNPTLFSTGEMNMLTAEQLLAAQKANVETLFGLTTKAFEGVEKLVELNVTASKAALAEAAEPPRTCWPSRTRKNCWPCKPPCSSPWPRRPPPTAVTCTTSPPAPAPSSASSSKAKSPKPRRSSWPSWTTPPRTHPPAPRPPSPCSRAPLPPATTPWRSVQKAVKQASDVAEANFNAVANTAVNASKTPPSPSAPEFDLGVPDAGSPGQELRRFEPLSEARMFREFLQVVSSGPFETFTGSGILGRQWQRWRLFSCAPAPSKLRASLSSF